MQDTEAGRTWEEMRSDKWEKANKKRRNGESTNTDGWHETEFLTNFCMFDCE